MKKIRLPLLFICLFGLLACNKDDGNVEVKTDKVSQRQIIQKVPATGKIQPVVSVDVSSNVSGVIVELAVEEGESVTKGQFLLQIDREKLQAIVNQREASVSSAKSQSELSKANLNKSKLDYERTKKLAEKNLVSQAELDGAKANYEVNKAQFASSLDQVKQGEALLSEAKDDLIKSTIYSPMTGIVSQLNKEEGERVIGSDLQGDIIMTIADLEKMQVEVQVDENDITQVSVNQKVEIEIDAFPKEIFAGTITHIANTGIVSGAGTQDEITNFEVEISVNDKIEGLRPGMSASVEIITKVKENIISVPIRAVAVRSSDEGGDPKEVLFVVNGEMVNQVEVKTGINDDEFIEITQGVANGDEIVTGSYKVLSQVLKDSIKVKVNNSKGEFGGKGQFGEAGN